jgi:hypothetical protein
MILDARPDSLQILLLLLVRWEQFFTVVKLRVLYVVKHGNRRIEHQ